MALLDYARLNLSISKKINLLTMGLLLPSLAAVVLLATYYFQSDLENLLKKGTLDVSRLLAGRVQAEMRRIADRGQILGASTLEEYKAQEDKLKFVETNLNSDSHFLSLTLFRLIPGTPKNRIEEAWKIFNTDFLRKTKIETHQFPTLQNAIALGFSETQKGAIEFIVAKINQEIPVLSMIVPFVESTPGIYSQVLGMDLNLERLITLFSESSLFSNTLLDRNGQILASSDVINFPLGESLKLLPIFSKINSSKKHSEQLDYKDKNGKLQIAAFHKIGFANLSVVSQIPFSEAYVARTQLFRRALFLAGIILSLAIALGLLLSSGITNPLEALSLAAKEIAGGNFKIRLPFNPQGDEIQKLAESFNGMAKGLEERDHLKTILDKFQSKEIAEQIKSGQMKLGGERKEVILFFSDIRGFTTLSEKIAPELLLKILNRYFSMMIRIVHDHGGVVNKFIGDSIMAIWGLPQLKENDSDRAIQALFTMRWNLSKLNQQWIQEGFQPLHIGMGLHRGPAVAGITGSDDRMEYTVVGDTVNTASRVESATKEFFTDILVSEEILKTTKIKYLVQSVQAQLKGKSESHTLYKLFGYIDKNGARVLIKTPYSTLSTSKSPSGNTDLTGSWESHRDSVFVYENK